MPDIIRPEIWRAYQALRPEQARNRLCHGPWRAMFFTFGGVARVCCLNGGFSLGRYPENSLRELWAGNKRKDLKKAISKKNLATACFVCREQMLAKNFAPLHSRMFDHLSDAPDGLPTVMSFEIANTCPFQCVMCSGMFSSTIRKKREKRAAQANPYDRAFVEQLEDFIPHLEEMKFFGGEPFFIPLYRDIWKRVQKKNPDCTLLVQTGTCLVDRKMKKILEKGRFNINISFDSLNPKTYETIRKGGKFEKFMKNQAWLLDYARAGQSFLGFSVCPMRQNVKELPEILNHCNNKQVPVYFNTVFKPPHCALWNLPSAELAQVREFLSGFELPADTAVAAKNRDHFKDFLLQLRRWETEASAMETALATARPGTRQSIEKKIKTKLELDRAEDAGVRAGAIWEKIESVLSRLPQGLDRGRVLMELDRTHPGLIIRGYENNTKEQLLEIISEDMARLAGKKEAHP